jgi:hypothetical protein
MESIMTTIPKAESMFAVPVPTMGNVHSEAPFKLQNSLPGHPLFEDARIKELLHRMPREHVEIRQVQLRDQHNGSYIRGERVTDVDPVSVFEQLREKPAWMLLHSMWDHDPEYGELMREYARTFAEHVPGMQEDLSDLGCWLFLSAGEIVVHFHADPDQSLLNQIRGSKTAFVYPTQVLPETTVEELVYTYNQGVVTYRPEYEASMFPPIHLAPGETVFLPLYTPHRVINDGGLSVSWNIGFHTRKTRHRRTVHLVNHELRTMGLNPSPFNHNQLVDTLKDYGHIALRAKRKIVSLLRRSAPDTHK